MRQWRDHRLRSSCRTHPRAPTLWSVFPGPQCASIPPSWFRGRSSFNHLGNFEERAVRLRSILHGFLVREAGAQLVGAHGVGECVAILLSAVAAGDLRHGLDLGGVELVQSLNESKDGVQVFQHADTLLSGQLEVCQICDVRDVFLRNHALLLRDYSIGRVTCGATTKEMLFTCLPAT